MSSQSEPPPLNVAAVRRARQWIEDPESRGTTDADEVIRGLLETYENLSARYAYLAASHTKVMEKQAAREASPAHPNTMIEGGGRG